MRSISFAIFSFFASLAYAEDVTFQGVFNDIANAIISKDGGSGMTPSQMAGRISSIPSHDKENWLIGGCPRIDLIQLSEVYEELYVASENIFTDEAWCGGYFGVSSGTAEIREVEVSNDGIVTETSNFVTGKNTSITISTTGNRFVVWRIRATTPGAIFNGYFRINYDLNLIGKSWAYRPVAMKGSCSHIIGDGNSDASINGIPSCSYFNIKCNLGEDSYCKPNEVLHNSGSVQFADISCTTIRYYPYNSPALRKVRMSGKFQSSEFSFAYGCKMLSDVDLSQADLSEAYFGSYSFYNCNNVQNLVMPSDPNRGFRRDAQVSSSMLTHDSLIGLINSLYDLSSHGLSTKVLKIGSDNIAKLSEAEKAVATDKGWTLQ